MSFIVAFLIGEYVENLYSRKKKEIEDIKKEMDNIDQEARIKQEKKVIKNKERELENLNLKYDKIENISLVIFKGLCIICVITFIVMVVIFLFKEFKLIDLNEELDDIEVVSYKDEENDIIITGEYIARMYKRKVCFDLNVNIRNLNEKEIIYVRVIDKNSNEKFDVKNLFSGNNYSHILVDNVDENTEYDIELKNIVFEE